MIRIENLSAMDTRALRTSWEEAVGRPPPARASDDYMRAVVAYTVQEKTGPKLSAATCRRLEKIAAGINSDAGNRPPPSRLKEGTKILREWNGTTHEVVVLSAGFEYRGACYRSLSAIAREITGARWSGPRFFGLNGKEGAHAA